MKIGHLGVAQVAARLLIRFAESRLTAKVHCQVGKGEAFIHAHGFDSLTSPFHRQVVGALGAQPADHL